MTAPTKTDFAYSLRPYGVTGQRKGHVGIFCSECDHEEWAVADNPGWGTRIFRRRGWALGNHRNKDVCPSCVMGRHMPEAKKETQPVPKTVATPTPEPKPVPPPRVNGTIPPADAPVADLPRQPTWADNRRIRQDLDLSYDVEAGRYFNNNTDESVAKRLDVPRAWVSTIRELFGPDRCEDDDLRAKALISVLAEARERAMTAEKAACAAIEQASEASRMVALILKAAQDAGLEVAA